MRHLFVFSIPFMLIFFFLAGCSSLVQDIKTISKPVTFTVTFDSNCADFYLDEPIVQGTMESQQFTKNKSKPLSKNRYTRDDLAFLGWAEDPSAAEPVYKDEQLFTAVKDTTLYAVWGKPNYKIICKLKNLDGNGYEEKPVLCYGEPGTRTSVTAPEIKGFTPEAFDQIEIDQKSETVQEIPIIYNRNKYTITFFAPDCTGHMEGIEDDRIVELPYQTLQKLPQCTFTNPDTTLIFEGWTIGSDDTQIYYPDEGEIEVTDNLSLYARWMDKGKSRYKVIHLFQEIGSGDIPSVVYNQKAEYPAQNLSGYDGTLTEAEALSVEGFKAEPFDQIEIGQNTEVEIKYSRNKYTITFDHNDECTGTMDPETAWYQEKKALLHCGFTSRDPNKKFAGWSYECPHTNKIVFLNDEEIEITHDLILYAQWEDINTSDYMVKHFFQNIDDNRYTEDPNYPHQILEGEDGSDTEAKAYTVPGFEAKPFNQIPIIDYKADEENPEPATIVEIYYKRNTVTLTFDLAGGTMKSSVDRDMTMTSDPVLSADKLFLSLKYGAPVPALDVKKTDHKLTGWTPALPSVATADGSYTAGWEESYTYTADSSGNGLHGTTTKKQGSVAKASIRGLPHTAEIYVVPKGTVAKINTDGSSVWGLGDNLGTEEDHVHGAFYPQAQIELSPYIMSQYPVTVELCESIMSSYRYDYKFDDSRSPMQPYGSDPANNITWYNAVSFCNLLSDAERLEPVYYYIDKHGVKVTDPRFWPIGDYPEILGDHTKNGYRLPTNAEWEFAARGGNPSDESWHDAYSGAKHAEGAALTTKYDMEDVNLSKVAYYKWNINKQKGPCPVGQWAPNRLGLYDMSGGICEWTYDYYNGITNFNNEYNRYRNAEGIIVDPRGIEQGNGKNSSHSLRGGSYFSSPFYCTVTYILLDYAYKTKYSYGLRLCRNAE